MAILSLYVQFTVASYIIFVERIPILIFIRLHLKFGTVEHLENRLFTTSVKVLFTTKKTYTLQGFNLAVIKTDPEFESLRTNLAASNILMNVCAKNEHVPEVERSIHNVKERCRVTNSTLPFKTIPAIISVALVCPTVFWIHVLPASGRMYITLRPRYIVTG